MSFRMIEPETVDDTALVSSTVPENDAPVWDNTTDYAADAEVMVTTGFHAIYRAAAPSGPGNGGAVDPTTDTDNSHWVNIRSTNRWRAFDQYIGDPTGQADSAQWVIDAVGIVDSVALFGLSANSVTIVAKDSSGTEVYNDTHSLQDDSGVFDLYTYFFSPIIRADRLVVTDLPPYAGGQIAITVNDVGEDVQVGQIVIGRQEQIGVTVDQVVPGIADFSRKERDPNWGRYTVVERDYADTLSLPFAFPTSRVDYLLRRLAGRRAKLTVFASDSQYRSNDYAVYGFFKTFQTIAQIGKESEGTIELESIT